MTVSMFLAWYDFWVGLYWDRKNRALYICPLPCVVIKIEATENRPEPLDPSKPVNQG